MLNKKLMCLILVATGQIISAKSWATPRKPHSVGNTITHSITHSVRPSVSKLETKSNQLFEPLNQTLERFSTDSKSFMNESPPKFFRVSFASGG